MEKSEMIDNLERMVEHAKNCANETPDSELASYYLGKVKAYEDAIALIQRSIKWQK